MTALLAAHFPTLPVTAEIAKRAGRLPGDLLKEQLGEVVIPPAVLAELRVSDNLPGSEALRNAVTAGWLRVEGVGDNLPAGVLRRDLDPG
jgi:hypothetical protein